MTGNDGGIESDSNWISKIFYSIHLASLKYFSPFQSFDTWDYHKKNCDKMWFSINFI